MGTEGETATPSPTMVHGVDAEEERQVMAARSGGADGGGGSASGPACAPRKPHKFGHPPVVATMAVVAAAMGALRTRRAGRGGGVEERGASA